MSQSRQGPSEVITARLPAGTLARIDSVLADVEAETPGVLLSRVDAVRLLLAEALVARGK